MSSTWYRCPQLGIKREQPQEKLLRVGVRVGSGMAFYRGGSCMIGSEARENEAFTMLASELRLVFDQFLKLGISGAKCARKAP